MVPRRAFPRGLTANRSSRQRAAKGGSSSDAVKPAGRARELVEALSSTTGLSLDVANLSQLKRLVRQDDDCMRAAFDAIMTRLENKHAQIRLLLLLVIDYLFMRSRIFRHLLLPAHLLPFLRLTLGIHPAFPLPPPAARASLLRARTLECLQAWAAAFVAYYPSLGMALRYLGGTLKLPLPQGGTAGERAGVEGARERERRERAARVHTAQLARYERARAEWGEWGEEMRGAVGEMDAVIRVLEGGGGEEEGEGRVGAGEGGAGRGGGGGLGETREREKSEPADKPALTEGRRGEESCGEESGGEERWGEDEDGFAVDDGVCWEGFGRADLRTISQRTEAHARLSHRLLAAQARSDNPGPGSNPGLDPSLGPSLGLGLVRRLSALAGTVQGRYLVMSQEWVHALTRVDPLDPGSRDEVLRAVIAVRGEMKGVLERCRAVGVTWEVREEGGEEGGEKEGEDEGEEDVEWEEGGGNELTGGDGGDADADVGGGGKRKVGDVESDGFTGVKRKHHEKQQQTQEQQQEVEGADLEHENSPPSLTAAPLAAVAAAAAAAAAAASASESEAEEQQGVRSQLLKQAPQLPWGPHLLLWGEEEAGSMLANQRGLSVSNHWGPVDDSACVPAQRVRELMGLQVSYYEPPKGGAGVAERRVESGKGGGTDGRTKGVGGKGEERDGSEEMRGEEGSDGREESEEGEGREGNPVREERLESVKRGKRLREGEGLEGGHGGGSGGGGGGDGGGGGGGDGGGDVEGEGLEVREVVSGPLDCGFVGRVSGRESVLASGEVSGCRMGGVSEGKGKGGSAGVSEKEGGRLQGGLNPSKAVGSDGVLSEALQRQLGRQAVWNVRRRERQGERQGGGRKCEGRDGGGLGMVGGGDGGGDRRRQSSWAEGREGESREGVQETGGKDKGGNDVEALSERRLEASANAVRGDAARVGEGTSSDWGVGEKLAETESGGDRGEGGAQRNGGARSLLDWYGGERRTQAEDGRSLLGMRVPMSVSESRRLGVERRRAVLRISANLKRRALLLGGGGDVPPRPARLAEPREAAGRCEEQQGYAFGDAMGGGGGGGGGSGAEGMEGRCEAGQREQWRLRKECKEREEQAGARGGVGARIRAHNDAVLTAAEARGKGGVCGGGGAAGEGDPWGCGLKGEQRVVLSGGMGSSVGISRQGSSDGADREGGEAEGQRGPGQPVVMLLVLLVVMRVVLVVLVLVMLVVLVVMRVVLVVMLVLVPQYRSTVVPQYRSTAVP
ncbi:hypothetical protein CLOP_g23221 [Closterium sp. NIES-67]|nr:hypothetical protein CLOP_g23221 [Closterium sp. NIES-67]